MIDSGITIQESVMCEMTVVECSNHNFLHHCLNVIPLIKGSFGILALKTTQSFSNATNASQDN